MTRVHEIIQFAHELRDTYHTRDPFTIARAFGFVVLVRNTTFSNFTAHILKHPNCPVTIAVNGRFSPVSQMVLCAHELGHAFLHDDGINHFDITAKNAFTNVEYEANLFAIALLFDEEDFKIPLSAMSNYTLKTILDYNMSE